MPVSIPVHPETPPPPQTPPPPETPPWDPPTPKPMLTRAEVGAQRLNNEAQAYIALKYDGCPPCCEPEDTLQDLPHDYLDRNGPVDMPRPVDKDQVISYWRTVESNLSKCRILSLQLEDWKSFRRFQRKSRQNHPSAESLSLYAAAMTERRRAHSLDDIGPLVLFPDPMDQSHSLSWTEFQDYHVFKHKSLEQQVHDYQDYLQEAREDLKLAKESGDVEEIEWIHSVEEDYKYLIKIGKRAVLLHQVFLFWTEEQRSNAVRPG